MKNKNRNINQLLKDKPELGFIIGVLSKENVPADFADYRRRINKNPPADFTDLRRNEKTLVDSADELSDFSQKTLSEMQSSQKEKTTDARYKPFYKEKSIPLAPFSKGEFIRLIKHHRLDSIFYKAVQEQNINLPTELKEKLEQINKLNKMRMMKLTAELIRIHKLFTKNGIEYISLKGPALSQQIYGDYTIRSSRDLDILVKAEDLDKVNLLLNKIDYHTSVKDFKKHKKAHHDIAFFNTERKVQIEIHTRLFSFKKLLEYNKDELFKSKNKVVLNNNYISVLNKNINSKFLYAHAQKHSWELFYWVTDLIKLDYNKTKLLEKFIINENNNKRNNHFKFLLYTLSLNKTIKHKLDVFVIYFRRFNNWIKKNK